VIWISQINCVVSAGWDGRLCFWDPRSPNQPALFFDLGKKVYSMSHFYPLLVIGMQDRVCTYLNLNEIGQPGFGPKVKFESHLKYQTRSVAVFPEGNGYGISSIEGRVAIKYIDKNLFSQGDEVKQMNTKYHVI
jgi:mRNA export factor